MQWNNMRNNACVCCSTKQIQHEEFSLLNHPKTSPVTLHYFLGNQSTIRTIKGLHFIFWNFCPSVITLVSGTSVEAFLKLFKCNRFTQRFFPSFTYVRFGLSLSCTFLLRFNCPQLVSAYDKSLGSVIKHKNKDLHDWNLTWMLVPCLKNVFTAPITLNMSFKAVCATSVPVLYIHFVMNSQELKPIKLY